MGSSEKNEKKKTEKEGERRIEGIGETGVGGSRKGCHGVAR